MMDYKKVGLDVLAAIGGKENVVSVTHCATRLRFELVDKEKVDKSKLDVNPGVISVVDSGGQFQVIVGNDVQTAFKSITKEVGQDGEKNDKNHSQESLISRFISVISTTFTPMIPAITGAGMVKAILAILTLLNLISPDSTTYIILNTISDAAFYFMPVLLAYGAAIKFEVSPILAITVSGILLHPDLISLFADHQTVTFAGMPVLAASYAGSVVPIILAVWIMSYVDRFAEWISPSFLKFFLKPMIIFLIMGPLTLIVIGPLGVLLNDAVANGAEWINGKASWLIPFLMGGLQPFLVLTGTAWAMTPIATAQLSKYKQETVNGPGMLASNIAQAGATLAVAMKTKNKELKQLAGSAGLTALMGITEPSLFGVTLKLKKPLFASMIGGALGGLYAGLSGMVRYAFVSPGLAGLAAFIGKNPMNIVHAIITCVIAFTSTFVITYLIGFDDETEEENTIPEHHGEEVIVSPMQGKAIPLADVDDGVFSKELLGKGVGLIAEENELFAPLDGTVVTVLDSKHAIGLQSDSGIELLIHVGIDTVNLAGEPFELFVQADERVKKGQKLMKIDFAMIEQANYDSTVIMVVTNTDKFKDVEVTLGEKQTGESLITVE